MESTPTTGRPIGRWRLAAASVALTLLSLVATTLTPLSAPAQAAAAAPSATTATVSGTIRSTQNPDVGAANVQISKDVTDESGLYEKITTTDASGHYTLTFQGSGSISLVIGAKVGSTVPQGPYLALRTTISYTAGQVTTGVDYLVTYTPTVTVVATYDDAARTPVDRQAHLVGQGLFRNDFRNTGQTGAVFSGLAPATYHLNDSTGTGVGFAAQLITVTNQDLRVTVLVSASERGSVVSVTVSTDDGSNQPAAVYLDPIGSSTRSYTASPVSGSTNAYTFPNVVVGTYRLRAVPTSPAYPTTWYADSFTADGATTVAVTTGGSTLSYALAIHTPSTLSTPNQPTISGAAQLDGVLTAVVTGWGPAPVTLSYSWSRNGVAIPGATSSTYTVTGSDLGLPLSVKVTGTKPGYTTVAQVSVSVTPPPGFATTPTPVIPQPAITGTVLTATVGTWSPTPTSFVYAWYRDGVRIPGATSVSYRLVTADSGARMTFSATASRAGYTSVTRTSAPTDIVAYRFTPSSAPKITGQAAVGRTLTASTGAVTPTPTSYSFQWLRGTSTIAGATSSTYLVSSTDLNAAITVRVTAVRAGYQSLAQTSAATSAVLKGFTTTPTPAIIGVAKVGVTLVASTPSWRPLPVQLSFRWSVGGVAVPDTGGTIYKVGPADVGKTITLTVTGSAAGYLTESRTSVATRPVVGVFTSAPTPTITGTARVGSTLSANGSGWLPDHVSIGYQWLRNGIPISGATAGTLRLSAADSGKRITVTVTGTKSGYATESRTSASVVVSP